MVGIDIFCLLIMDSFSTGGESDRDGSRSEASMSLAGISFKLLEWRRSRLGGVSLSESEANSNRNFGSDSKCK